LSILLEGIIIDDLLLRAQVVYKLTGAVHLFAKCGKASEKKRRRILKEKRKQYDNDMTKKAVSTQGYGLKNILP
jgi:hypothetical protein